MSKSFYGSTITEQDSFVTNFSARLTAMAAELPVDPAVVTSVATLSSGFGTAASEAQQPSTRTPTAIVLRNQKWAELLPMLRSVATSLNESPLVSDFQLSEM